MTSTAIIVHPNHKVCSATEKCYNYSKCDKEFKQEHEKILCIEDMEHLLKDIEKKEERIATISLSTVLESLDSILPINYEHLTYRSHSYIMNNVGSG